MPLDLLKAHHERNALSGMLTKNAREIESLRRAGFVGSDPVTEATTAQADLGSIFTAPNQIIVSSGIGTASVLDVPQQSLVLRAADDVIAATATAGDILYMDSGGTLGFTDTDTWTDDANVANNLHLKTVEVSGTTTTYAMNEGVTLYIPVYTGTSADLTMQLPTPTFSGKWVYVSDVLGGLDGSHRIKFTCAGGSDVINGNAAYPSSGWFTSAYSSFLFLCGKSGGVAYWSGSTL